MTHLSDLSEAKRRAVLYAHENDGVSTAHAAYQTIQSLLRFGWLRGFNDVEPIKLAYDHGWHWHTAGTRYHLTDAARRALADSEDTDNV